MRHTFSFIATLAVFWELMSGHTSALLLGLGGASVALVIFIVHRMNIIDHETHPVGLVLRLPKFLFWLLMDLVASNINVMKRVWQVKPDISPSVLKFKLDHSSDMEKVIFSNAITVTPGTITIDLQKDTMLVHALTDDASSNIRSGEKTEKVRQLIS